MALNDFRAVFFPYCLQRQDDGRYVALNREYKPVGMFVEKLEWINYAEYPVSVRIKGLTKTLARKLSIHGNDSLDQIYLYNDVNNPIRSKPAMDRYLEKLRILAKLRIEGYR